MAISGMSGPLSTVETALKRRSWVMRRVGVSSCERKRPFPVMKASYYMQTLITFDVKHLRLLSEGCRIYAFCLGLIELHVCFQVET